MNKQTKVTFKLLDLLVMFVMIFSSPMSAFAAPSPTGATIASDLADYPPGATVTLTGAGWAVGETVHIVVNDTIGQSWQHVADVTSADGTIVDVFSLPTYFVSNYDVTATGPISGSATIVFTDLSIGTYDQCSNDVGTGYTTGDTGCRWTNGNLQSNNSRYFEGDATVQRVWLTDLAPGTSHTLRLKYGTTKGGHHAYDYLTTWNYSENWIVDADLCQDISGCTAWGADDLLPIPADPNPAFTTDGVPQPAGRNFTMRNGDLTLATIPAIVSGDYTGDSETVITITFTVGSDPDACATKQGTTTCSVVLWFGAHVALTSEWESGGGAGQVSGSPYHVALDAVDNASVGQRDNQMQANAVIPNGTIIIVKDAIPNSAQDFSFNLTNSTTVNQSFSLDDDADGMLPNTTSPNYSVPPGNYTATELNIPTGWTLTNLVCVDPSNNTTVNLGTATATINLASAETVTCTYTDTNAGRIIVDKVTVPGVDPQSFSFDANGGSYVDFSLTDAAAPNDQALAPGNYSVSETVPSDWVLTSATCDDGSLPSAIGLDAGETVTCTFTNTKQATSLIVTKTPSAESVCNGSTVEYIYEVTNTGDITLTVNLEDDLLGDIDGGSGFSLSPGASQTFTASSTINGTVTNTVTATGTSAGGQTATATADATVTGHDCTISVTKTPSQTSVCNGSEVSYTIVVTNNSTFDWTGDVVDDVLGTLATGVTIAAGDSATYTPSHEVTGTVHNTVTADGAFNDPDATAASDTADATVTGHDCTISVTKTPSQTNVCNGSSVSYEIVVTNNSTFDWTGDVVDNVLGTLDTGVTIAAGQSATYTPSHNVTGTVHNTVTADGAFNDPDATAASDTADATVTGHDCTISVTKTPSQTNVCNGSSVSYEIVVTNNSTFDWTGDVVDNVLGTLATDVTIAAGDSATYTPSHEVTGTVHNTVTADGAFNDPDATAASDTADASVTGHDCTISVTKTPSVDNVCIGSDTLVTYTVTVTNNSDGFDWTGDVTDTVLGTLATDVTIAAGDSVTYTPTHTVNATTSNTVTADGAFNDTDASAASDSASATVNAHDCTISITKTPSIDNVCNGSNTHVTYTYVVTNNSDFFSVSGSVSDDKFGSVGNFGPLAPGASATLTKVATVNGTVTNIATATGTFNDSDATTDSDTATATVTGHNCSISITKTPSTANVCNGSHTQVTYTYVVTNTGDFFGASGSVTDDNGTPGNTADDVAVGNFGPLAPGASATLTKAFSVNGTVTNTGTAIATFSDSNSTIASASASATVTGHNCTISITKTPSVTNVCNSQNTQVTYTYVVTNNSDFYRVTGSVTDNPLGSIGTFTDLAPGASQTFTKAATINATTTNTATATGTFNDGSGTSASATASATVTGKVCQIIIKKITKPTTSLTQFSFDANGTGYADFALSDQQTNTQNLNPGTYTVKELVPLGWVLTGIGGSTDPNTPYNCTVNGSGGSTGIGDLNTQTATITLQIGDTVTCVFENTGQGVTRTQGFWATHTPLANIAWFGGTAFGHTFPGVTGVPGIGDKLICGRPIDDLGKLMGGFWSDVSKTSTGAKRSALDQARMQLLQQLLSAELNASAFGTVPSGGSGMFATWENILCNGTTNQVKTALGQAASFNTAGDSSTFTPGTSADSKYARSVANIPFWNKIAPPF